MEKYKYWDMNIIPEDVSYTNLREPSTHKPFLAVSEDIEYNPEIYNELIQDLAYVDYYIRQAWSASGVDYEENKEVNTLSYPGLGQKNKGTELYLDPTLDPLRRHGPFDANKLSDSPLYYMNLAKLDEKDRSPHLAGFLRRNLNNDIQIEYQNILNEIRKDIDPKYDFLNDLLDLNYCRESKNNCFKKLNPFSWEIPSMKWFRKQLYDAIKKNCPFITDDYNIVAWVNLFGKDHRSFWHQHFVSKNEQESLLNEWNYPEKLAVSGNFIIKPSSNPTYTQFYDPEMGRWKIPSSAGKLMLFDSRILHNVVGLRYIPKGEVRISIAMDIYPNATSDKHLWGEESDGYGPFKGAPGYKSNSFKKPSEEDENDEFNFNIDFHYINEDNQSSYAIKIGDLSPK